MSVLMIFPNEFVCDTKMNFAQNQRRTKGFFFIRAKSATFIYLEKYYNDYNNGCGILNIKEETFQPLTLNAT